MTITRPLRLIILHFSHMGLTDGLTFIINLLYGAASLLKAVGDSAAF